MSHNDVGTLTGQTGLPEVSFAEINQLIVKINEVARYIVLCNREVDCEFVPSVTPKAWTERLFRVLREGVEQLPPELRKTKAQQDAPSGGGKPSV